jgi:hypothetical protein
VKKGDKYFLSLSLLICILILFIIPSKFHIEGMGRYVYGFPFSFITIYQHEPNSIWFGSNFFTGNVGLSFNPLSVVLNVTIIYITIRFIRNIIISRRVSKQ